MTFTTLDSLVVGALPRVQIYKTGGTQKAANLLHSLFYAAGFPGPAVASSAGIGGESLTSYAGQLPFPATVSGKEVRLFRLEGLHTSSMGAVSVCDRLWHNSGYSVTSTSSQSFTSFAAIPSRDRDGATAGAGVMCAMEVTSTLGSGTPTITVSYTNSAGTSGRTGTIGPIQTTSPVGTFYTMALQDGDVGVRSIQSAQSSATMTSGSVSFVLYREISSMPLAAASFGMDRDCVALGFPIAYNSTVPFLVTMSTGTTSTSFDGALSWAQG